jgi:hypothetical protein
MSDIVYWAEARGRQTEHVLGVYRTEAEARARCEQHAADTRKYEWGKDPFNGDGWHRYVVCMAKCDGSEPTPLHVLGYAYEDLHYRWRDASHA